MISSKSASLHLYSQKFCRKLSELMPNFGLQSLFDLDNFEDNFQCPIYNFALGIAKF